MHEHGANTILRKVILDANHRPLSCEVMRDIQGGGANTD